MSPQATQAFHFPSPTYELLWGKKHVLKGYTELPISVFFNKCSLIVSFREGIANGIVVIPHTHFMWSRNLQFSLIHTDNFNRTKTKRRARCRFSATRPWILDNSVPVNPGWHEDHSECILRFVGNWTLSSQLNPKKLPLFFGLLSACSIMGNAHFEDEVYNI